MSAEAAQAPEFSRPVALAEIEDAPLTRHVEADEAERAALAVRFGVVAVRRLEAEITASGNGDEARASGVVRAHLERRCVATLELLDETIDERFSVWFKRGPVTAAPDAEIEIDENSPEPLEGDVLDLGEIAAQQMALAMDAYPRRADAALVEDFGGADAKRRQSPFAALEALKNRGSEDRS